jgi:hypothetical protein
VRGAQQPQRRGAPLQPPRSGGDPHAHGPLTKAQIDLSSIKEARAGTESAPAPMPGASPSSASKPRRTLVFSTEAGAAPSCAVPTNQGSAPVSMNAASAGMIMTSLILTPRCRADSCAGFVFKAESSKKSPGRDHHPLSISPPPRFELNLSRAQSLALVLARFFVLDLARSPSFGDSDTVTRTP